MNTEGHTASNPTLSACKIYKSFGHISALCGADITLNPGEVTALIGDNGSGKSTLVKVLSGIIKADKGTIAADGKIYEKFTSKDALKAGIAVVFQDLSLDDYRDASANIFLGNELTYCGIFLRQREMREKSLRLLKELNINIPDPMLPVGSFSGGQRQAVAIARAVYYGKRTIIFDEPTAAMGVKESAEVLRIIKSLARKGLAVLIVSHNLHQVFKTADRIALMRRGRIVSSMLTSSSSLEETDRALKESDNID